MGKAAVQNFKRSSVQFSPVQTCHGFVNLIVIPLSGICDAADDELFSKALRLSNHVLHPLLPPPSTASQHYNMRERTHSLQLLSYLNILLRYQIVISSHTCCIKTLTRPIIPVLYHHWTGLEILFYCICILSCC